MENVIVNSSCEDVKVAPIPEIEAYLGYLLQGNPGLDVSRVVER